MDVSDLCVCEWVVCVSGLCGCEWGCVGGCCVVVSGLCGQGVGEEERCMGARGGDMGGMWDAYSSNCANRHYILRCRECHHLQDIGS